VTDLNSPPADEAAFPATLSRYVVRPMEVRHIPAVTAIERLSFSSAWPASAYKREIERNQMAYYAVAQRTQPGDEPKRAPRFAVTDDGNKETDRMLARLARRILGESASLSVDPEDADELEAIVGYAGLWLMVDSAHITTIAVDPPYRGEGIGELLLVGLLQRAIALGAREATLECRVSNYIAQALYRKYTFRNSGLRKRYYSDDGEDALIMTTDSLGSETFKAIMARNVALLEARMALNA
jgi:[ribosomal protein S18]-alanine N-acetyltransferase